LAGHGDRAQGMNDGTLSRRGRIDPRVGEMEPGDLRLCLDSLFT
jgi:hypothetical protein